MSEAIDRFRLDGSTALVTGASSGLGRHFALLLAQAGAEVVLAARRKDRLDALVEHVRALGRKALAVPMDVTDAASVHAAFEAMDAAGMLPDVVINNAGVSTFKPAVAHSVDEWDGVLDTNLRGAFVVSTEAARRLIAAGRPGSIVNIASLLSLRVAGGVAPYAASKAGLLQLGKALALEWARHGIRVNSLCPGYIETDLNREFLRSEAGEKMRLRVPQRRFGQPDDLDGPLLLLASPAGAFLTGAAISADGGHLLSTL